MGHHHAYGLSYDYLPVYGARLWGKSMMPVYVASLCRQSMFSASQSHKKRSLVG